MSTRTITIAAPCAKDGTSIPLERPENLTGLASGQPLIPAARPAVAPTGRAPANAFGQGPLDRLLEIAVRAANDRRRTATSTPGASSLTQIAVSAANARRQGTAPALQRRHRKE